MSFYGYNCRIMLTLFIDNPLRPELIATEFYSPLSKGIFKCQRGKTAGASASGTGNFQWTPGVKALSILSLRTAASSRAWCLHGESGSLAASLDFALGKPPSWLCEIFGWDSEGKPQAGRFFRRSNPELKRAGPLSICFSERLSESGQIKIFLNNRLETNPEILNSLANAIEIEANSVARGRDKPQFEFSSIIAESWRGELLSTIKATDIFSSGADALLTKQAAKMLSFKGKALFKKINFVDSVDASLSTSARLGALPVDLKKLLKHSKPISVALPVSHAGAYSIFSELQLSKQLPFEVDFNYSYAIEIMNRILKKDFVEPPDLCVLGLAPAATLLNSNTNSLYKPVMLLPGMTHRVLRYGHKPDTARNSSPAALRYLLLKEDFSTSVIYLNRLIESDYHKSRQLRLDHRSPDEAAKLLPQAEPGTRAILSFPYSILNRSLNNCHFLDESYEGAGHIPCVLFANERLYQDKARLSAICIAIRDIIFQLKVDKHYQTLAVRRAAEDQGLVERLKRFSGINFSECLAST